MTKFFAKIGAQSGDSYDVRFLDTKRNEVHAFGFKPLDRDIICLMRCPNCNKENYAMAVGRGVCAWCGWDANKDSKIL